MPNNRSFRVRLLATALALVAPVMAHAASVTFIGTAVIPGTDTDKSKLPSTLLEDGMSPANGLNGFGSGIAYAGHGIYYLLGDRGPNKVEYKGGAAVDNTTSYPNRYQRFKIAVTPDAASKTGYTVKATHVGTTLLKNKAGKQYLGISTAGALRFDSEGIRVAPDSSVYVSDEYGPNVFHFSRSGKQIDALPIPTNFSIDKPSANANQEAADNKMGRVTNRGLEGLAISPDGSTLVAALQSSLTQEGGLKGLNDRFLVYDLKKPKAQPKQYLYHMDNTKQAISEILAVNSHQILVDERDGVGGAKGIKLLYLVDFAQSPAPTELTKSAFPATTTTNGLPAEDVPAGVVALKKTLFADLGKLLNDANPFVNADGLPDKIEGITWGPDLPNGDHLLLATNDNDFTLPSTDGYRPNYVFAFAVPREVLPGFKAQNLPK